MATDRTRSDPSISRWGRQSVDARPAPGASATVPRRGAGGRAALRKWRGRGHRPSKVLLVEDNPGDTRLIRELLAQVQDGCFSLECVDRLSPALERIEEGGIDLVLLDLALPDSQGLDTFYRVKAQEPRIPIVLLTGTSDEELSVRAVREGAQDYLVKGQVDGNLLVRSLSYAIERNRVESELVLRSRITHLFLSKHSHEVYADVLDAVLDALHSECGRFGYINEEGGLACPSLTKDIRDRCQVADKDIVFPRSAWGGLWGQSLIEAQSIYSNDSLTLPEVQAPLTNALAVPILFGGELIGQFAVGNKNSDYDEVDVARLEAIADHIAPILHARLSAARHEEARTVGEDALRLSEARMRALLSAMPDMMFCIRADGTYLEFLPGTAVEPVASPGEFIGKRVPDVMPADLAERTMRDIERALATGNLQGHEYSLTIGDDVRHYEYRMVPSGMDEVLAIVRDITERKRVQKESRQFRDQLQLSVHRMPIAHILWDLEGNVTEWNPAAEQIFGFSRTEAIGHPLLDLVPEKDHAAVADVMRSLLAGRETSYSLPDNNIRKDGKLISCQWFNTPIKYPDGETFSVLSMVLDITQRLKAEEELKASEARLKEAQKLARMGFLTWNLKTNEMAWSEEVYDLYGIDRQQQTASVDLTMSRVHHGDLELVRQSLDRDLKGEQEYDHDNRILRPDGEVIWVHARGDLQRDEDGTPVAMLGSVVDITERKRAEEALKQSEAKYRDLVETSQDLIWRCDAEGRFTYVNAAWKRHTGYEIDEVLGRRVTEFLTPEVAARDTKEFARLLEGGSLTGYETIYISKSGEMKHLVFNAMPYRDADGNVIGTKGTAYDITKRKRAEQALRESRERLRNLAASLQTVREEERTLVAREMHDELGQALTGVRMDLHWLMDKLPRDETALLERTRSMASLVDSTIETVRQIAWRLRPPILDDLGLAAAIEWYADQFRNRSGLDVQLDLYDEGVVLDDDSKTTVFRVVQEALTNVARHAEASNVKVHLGVSNGDVILTITDDGKGIADQEITRTDALGLIGMRERAGALGGRVAVERLDEGGTQVTISLPLDNEEGLARP